MITNGTEGVQVPMREGYVPTGTLLPLLKMYQLTTGFKKYRCVGPKKVKKYQLDQSFFFG